MMLRKLSFALAIWLGLWAAAPAAAPYKALIVTGQNGHNWKGTTPVLEKLLDQTGLFVVDVATSPAKGKDMSGFVPKFADYQVVILNYQGDPWPEPTKQAFVDYVSNGGGVVVYHFALAAFPGMERVQPDDRPGRLGRAEREGRPVRPLEGRQDRPRQLARQVRQPRPAATLPACRPRRGASHHQGPAAGLHALPTTSFTAGSAARRRTSPCWPRPSRPRRRGERASTSRCCSPSNMARAASSRSAWDTTCRT